MRSTIFFGKLLIFTILVIIVPRLSAEDRRTIPLDMYLIIDGSLALENSKNDAVSWISQQVVDRILMEGDRITVWNAGDKPEIIHSETISAASGTGAIKDKLQTLSTEGKTADFSSAMREVLPRVSQTPGDRISYTVLIASSATSLGPAFSGSSQNLFRWFRSKKYERWQVLVIAPDIGGKVQQSAQAYMSSVR